ncbi:MAG: hypothetical protein Pg6A_14650 [Termitinemataceae bacterium]|nr:MAG: hypothetical protein Pg6A_14650 [Termitinemataceae bacterium]
MSETEEVQAKKALVQRVREMGFREASALEHESLRVLIDDTGSFCPELCNTQDSRRLNAHWVPYFRANSPEPYSDSKNGSYWKSEHLYNMAGSFVCFPNYGTGHILDGIMHPVNGWTANEKWNFVKSGKDLESGAIWTLSTMESPDTKMPLSFRKVDALVPGESVLYSALKITNNGSKEVEITGGAQSLIGAPFFSPLCHISASAKEWIVPPVGSEYDATSRLAAGKEFISLSRAPLASGGETDISVAGGPIGKTDYIMGAIPKSSALGWEAVVNPVLKLVYLNFFPGPLGIEESNDVPIYFNHILLQYGGRSWAPWAPYEGGTDISYCLGIGGATSAWTAGLEYSCAAKKVLGSPVTFTIPAKGEKTFCQGSLFDHYEDNILDSGIVGVENEEGKLVCKSAAAAWRFNADTSFKVIRRL